MSFIAEDVTQVARPRLVPPATDDSVWEDAQDTYDRTVDTHIKRCVPSCAPSIPIFHRLILIAHGI